MLAERLEALVAWMRDAAGRPVRRQHLRRQAPRAGACLRGARRHRVDREERLRHQPRDRVVDPAGGRGHQPRPRARRALARSVRRLHAVPRRVPDRRARRRARARRHEVHRLPDDRARRARCRSSSGRTWTITCSAATSARRSVRGISPRRRPADPAWQPRPRDGARAADLWQRTDQELHGLVQGQRDDAHLAGPPAPQPGPDHRQRRRALAGLRARTTWPRREERGAQRRRASRAGRRGVGEGPPGARRPTLAPDPPNRSYDGA